MTSITGLIAVLLIFVVGPYRTMQKRWPRRWGPLLSVWTHGNLSLVTVVAVFVHLVLAGEFDNVFEFEASPAPPILTWAATALFVMTVVSGFYALNLTNRPSFRRRWLAFHRPLTYTFYLMLVPHVLVRGVASWTVVPLLVAAWIVWRRPSETPRCTEWTHWPLR